MRGIKGNVSRPLRRSRQKVLASVALLVGVIGVLQYLAGPNGDFGWTGEGSSTFRKPFADFQALNLDGVPRLEESAGRSEGNLRPCEFFFSLLEDRRVRQLATEWERLAPPHVEAVLKQEDLGEKFIVADREVIERHLGDLLRTLWSTYGTPIFAFWLKYFHLQISGETWGAWDLKSKATTSLSFEEHALGMWIAKQVFDRRVESQMDAYAPLVDGRELRADNIEDVAMLCGYSALLQKEQNASLHGEKRWEDAPEKFKLAIGTPDTTKYDDVIHAVVWSQLRYLQDKPKFEEVLLYLGNLCSYAPFNQGYMACGHGIGHGIFYFSGNSGLPRGGSEFRALEAESLESSLKHVAVRFMDGLSEGMKTSLTPDGGVKKEMINEGERFNGKPRETDEVLVHYTAQLGDGTVYQTSRVGAEDRPHPIRLDGHETIKGLAIAISTMNLKEFSKFTFSPEYAYGEQGSPDGLVPPNTPIVYEIELLHWNAAADDGYEVKETAEDRRNALSFDLTMLACERVASTMSIESGDAVLDDYASSSCYTGFYHEMHRTLINTLSRKVYSQDDTERVAMQRANKTFNYKVNSEWNDRVLKKCDSIGGTYLEALWGAFRHGKRAKLHHALRRAAGACYYNRGYFQLSYEDHMLDAYKFVSDSVTKCSDLGKEKCKRICEQEDLGKNDIKRVQGHNYPFTWEKCVSTCTRLAEEHVQPLCWHGIGSNLGILSKDCIELVGKSYKNSNKPPNPAEEEERTAEFVAMAMSGVSECLLLCASHDSCTRAMWESCVLGFLYMRGVQLLFGDNGSILVCEHLEEDPYLYDLCTDVLGGFVPENTMKQPVVGTFKLQPGSKERWNNATIPELRTALSIGPGHSTVLSCVLSPDPEKCFCKFPLSVKARLRPPQA
ncbi:FKBP-type peptidyl-prolyl cis-trans isomerase [Chloropicon primus]|nr:FKBP-type peptidyl-prolyl cis-trans isomerase [Chloropicon primus]